MTPESVGPFSRPVSVEHLPDQGLEEAVEASGEERAALAKDLRLPAVHELRGRFRITGSRHRMRVEGTVTARVDQVCVVTLEPFETILSEEVEVDFAAPSKMPEADAVSAGRAEPPDQIVGGRIDLGALAAEFLVLGLDPYPRKPGVDFSFDDSADKAVSPFAALKNPKPEN